MQHSHTLRDQFTYGTQYYRPPTPLPEEWDGDIERMYELTGINTFQLRVQWRWHEPREGEYVFDDLDRLFELAARNGRKVLFKFLLENAPDYIFLRYDGTRKDMNGAAMRPLAHGAYYCGGWLPCFDNPEVVRKAGEFVRVMVERYKDRPELLLWNVWNEPIARPIGECGCSHSVAAYRKWLKASYQSIDKLNDFFGKRWESFETVETPASPSDYAELFTWRRWALEAVTGRVRFVYDIVKELDPCRPVITHVGGCSILQDVAGGGSDDLSNAGEVDFYGCSLPTATILDNPISDCWPALQCDWLRSVSAYYWVYELYPDWGAWHPRVRIGDYKTKVLSPLACGAKGIVYWQYRAERLGMENNLSGLVNIDGSPKAISHESAKISGFIHQHEKFLMESRVKTSSIALVYSLKSDLINRVENTGNGGMWDFNLRNPDGSYLYKKALCGVYALFRELGYTVEWLDSRALAGRVQDFKLIYLPEYFMPEAGECNALQQFVVNGGKLIAEEGAGLRQMNTWVNSSWPSEPFRELFGVEIDDRFLGCFKPECLMVNGIKLVPGEDNFISSLIPEKGEVIGRWSDSSPAVVKNNNCIFIGSSLGALFHDGWVTQYDSSLNVMRHLLHQLNIAAPDYSLPRGVYIRQLENAENIMSFVFNRNEHEIEIKDQDYASEALLCYGENARVCGINHLRLAAGEIAVLLKAKS